MADDIRDIRTLKEIKDYVGDFAAWLEDKGDEIDRFRGVTINKEKEQRLADMRAKCMELHKLDSGIAHTYSPFDRTNRHGTVLVTLPEVFSSHDKRVTKILSELYAEADDVCFSSLGEGIRLSFSVLDMWDEYEYID